MRTPALFKEYIWLVNTMGQLMSRGAWLKVMNCNGWPMRKSGVEKL